MRCGVKLFTADPAEHRWYHLHSFILELAPPKIRLSLEAVRYYALTFSLVGERCQNLCSFHWWLFLVLVLLIIVVSEQFKSVYPLFLDLERKEFVGVSPFFGWRDCLCVWVLLDLVGIVQQKSLIYADYAAKPREYESESYEQVVEEVLFFVVVGVSLHRVANVAPQLLKLWDYKLAWWNGIVDGALWIESNEFI